MINVKELRIGNKVRCTISNDAGIYQVLGIPMWGMNGEGNGKEPLILIDRCPKELVPPSKLKPIPLTPEVLEKAGFKQFEISWDLLIYYPDIYLRYENGSIKMGIKHDTKVKHLHSLQNLIFALTGEELEINL